MNGRIIICVCTSMSSSLFHVKHIFLAVFLFSVIATKAQGILTLQDKPFVFSRVVDSSLWKMISVEKEFASLQEKEQMVFYWTNFFRMNPKRFFNEVIKEFIKQFPEANTKEIVSLENDINKAAPELPLLMTDKGLTHMAALQSVDLVKRGSIISHKSSSGKDFVQRIKEEGPYRCGAENIYVGAYDPLEALIALLVDYGVPDKGHRVNLLDPRFGKMGVSFLPAPGQRGLLVQDFACQ